MQKTKKFGVFILLFAFFLQVVTNVYSTEIHVANIEIGQIIEFGGRNWIVLSVEGNYAKILHETIVERRPYHYPHAHITWESSSLRAWLNNQFYNSFSAIDRARIRETYVINNNNPRWGTPGGANTTDRIFLLSIEEAAQYFDNNSARVVPREDGTFSQWWLRSPGFIPPNAAFITDVGGILINGNPVDFNNVIRPALWLRLDEYQNGSQICEPDCDCPECIGFHPPLTGVPGITATMAAMLGIVGVSAILWGVVLHRRTKQCNT